MYVNSQSRVSFKFRQREKGAGEDSGECLGETGAKFRDVKGEDIEPIQQANQSQNQHYQTDIFSPRLEHAL